MIDSVSPRLGALGALGVQQARKPVAAEGSGAAALRPGSGDAAAAGKSAVAGNVARALAQSAPVDSARVAELRQALAAGNYPVRPERIAEAMLASLKP